MKLGSLGCARCGACCEDIPLVDNTGVFNWSTRALEGVPDPRTDWDHWRQHGWADESRQRAESLYDPAGIHREDADFLAEHWHETADPGVYRCDQFDPEARTCRAHDSKPPVCRNFPWYGDGPTAQRAAGLSKQCSYLLDVPPTERPAGARPLIPIEVIR